MDLRYWDFRDLVDQWLRFLVGVLRSAIDVGVRAGGLEGVLVGIVLVSLATVVVLIPLTIVTIVWIVVWLVGFTQGRRGESDTGETRTNEDWRTSK